MGNPLIDYGAEQDVRDDLEMVNKIIGIRMSEMGYKVKDGFVTPKNAESGEDEPGNKYRIVWDEPAQGPEGVWYYLSPVMKPEYMNYRMIGIQQGYQWKTSQMEKPEEWNA